MLDNNGISLPVMEGTTARLEWLEPEVKALQHGLKDAEAMTGPGGDGNIDPMFPDCTRS